MPAPAALTEEEIFQRKTLDQLNAERPLGDVFFDFDKSEIRADARGPLQTNADWMKKWTGTQIMLEGHGDSRGSSEYNLALGTRRANSVKDYLVSLGVPATRVDGGQQGQRSAVLHGGERGLLAAEPARTLCDHGEIGQVGRRAEGRKPFDASRLSRRFPPSSPRPQDPRQFLSLTRYFAAFFPFTRSTGISDP